MGLLEMLKIPYLGVLNCILPPDSVVFDKFSLLMDAEVALWREG